MFQNGFYMQYKTSYLYSFSYSKGIIHCCETYELVGTYESNNYSNKISGVTLRYVVPIFYAKERKRVT